MLQNKATRMFLSPIGLNKNMRNLFLSLIFCLLSCFSVFSQTAEKFDEFGYINCEEYLARMDATLNRAHENSSSTVVIFVYEGKEQVYNHRKNKIELFLPKFGSAKAKIRSIKGYILLKNFPLERFKFIQAGFRENSSVEIWLVPSGVNQPKPTPTLEKMKYRKGKATGFCLGCCG